MFESEFQKYIFHADMFQNTFHVSGSSACGGVGEASTLKGQPTAQQSGAAEGKVKPIEQ